jgi:hypothetical protein
VGLPGGGAAVSPAAIPPAALTQGFFHASVFGIILVVAGIVAVVISGERKGDIKSHISNLKFEI